MPRYLVIIKGSVEYARILLDALFVTWFEVDAATNGVGDAMRTVVILDQIGWGPYDSPMSESEIESRLNIRMQNKHGESPLVWWTKQHTSV